MTYLRQSRLDSGLGLQVEIVECFYVVASVASIEVDDARARYHHQRRSRPAVRHRLVPACPNACTGHVLYGCKISRGGRGG